MNSQSKTALLGGAVIFIAAALSLWFLPNGDGEYRNSPNGRYLAEVYHLRRGTWLADRINYIDFELSEVGSDRVVWKVQFYPNGARVPSYGDRAHKFITWATDSSSVTVPIANGKQVTIPVP